MSRRSTVAVSTLTPALKDLSTPLPDMMFFSLVRTKAGPLPGLTCWNSTTLQSCWSSTRTIPFFRSFVVANWSPRLSSWRTKDSAQAAPGRGLPLGSPGGREVDHAQQPHGQRMGGALLAPAAGLHGSRDGLLGHRSEERRVGEGGRRGGGCEPGGVAGQ